MLGTSGCQPGRVAARVSAGLAGVRARIGLLEEGLGQDLLPPGAGLGVHDRVEERLELRVQVLGDMDHLLPRRRRDGSRVHLLPRSTSSMQQTSPREAKNQQRIRDPGQVSPKNESVPSQGVGSQQRPGGGPRQHPHKRVYILQGKDNQRMRGAGSVPQMPVSYKALGDQQQIKALQSSPPQNVTAPLPQVPGVRTPSSRPSKRSEPVPSNTNLYLARSNASESDPTQSYATFSETLATCCNSLGGGGGSFKGRRKSSRGCHRARAGCCPDSSGEQGTRGRGEVGDVPNPNVGTRGTFYLPPVPGSGPESLALRLLLPQLQRRAGSGLCFFCAGTALQGRIGRLGVILSSHPHNPGCLSLTHKALCATGAAPRLLPVPDCPKQTL